MMVQEERTNSSAECKAEITIAITIEGERRRSALGVGG
jgi:hypothetical protein